MATLSVALTGNPNTGKSTIFNELTGIRQKIGNWPGVTVDKKVGYTKHKDRAISVMDLPGTYSINGRSPEEIIVENYLSGEKPDIIVDVIDSSNIERNLFLCLQLLERRIPVLVDLNMMDEANRKGIKISTAKLEKLLGMPVVETVGRSKKSTNKLLDIFTSTVMDSYKNSQQVEEHIANIEKLKATISDKEKLEEADHDKYVYPLFELGWKIDVEIHPIMYTLKDWLKRNFSLFYKNVEQDGIVLC